MIALAKRMPERVGRALYREANTEMTEAKRRTPVDTGALRASGKVENPEYGETISVRLSFGGVSSQYAIFVHENLEALHKIGQAKFLESTLLESSPYMANRLAKRLHLETGD